MRFASEQHSSSFNDLGFLCKIQALCENELNIGDIIKLPFATNIDIWLSWNLHPFQNCLYLLLYHELFNFFFRFPKDIPALVFKVFLVSFLLSLNDLLNISFHSNSNIRPLWLTWNLLRVSFQNSIHLFFSFSTDFTTSLLQVFSVSFRLFFQWFSFRHHFLFSFKYPNTPIVRFPRLSWKLLPLKSKRLKKLTINTLRSGRNRMVIKNTRRFFF